MPAEGSPGGRRTVRPRRVAGPAVRAVGLFVFLIVLSGAVAAEAPAGVGDVTVTASPRWGPVPAGSWTPYAVRVRNDGLEDIEGGVVLVPQPEPAAKPGSPSPSSPPPPPTATSSPTTVLSLGGRAVTAAAPQRPGGRPLWPTYRTAVSVPVGTEKVVTVMVLEAPFGYRAEVSDRRGRIVATNPGPPPRPVARERTAVLLLSGVKGADAALESQPQEVAPNLDVIQLNAGRDLPDEALQLAGLDAVLLDDFDTATLTGGQVRALQDYVSLGGSLVMAGGVNWSRNVGPLPAGLAPLQATGSAPASLAPLADLAAGATAATATVATGEVRAGRVVVASPGGPALVVEADYGAGKVVQLAYDPLAGPIASDALLRGPAWDQALGRVARRGGILWDSAPSGGGESQLWSSSVGVEPWPSWPPPAAWLLGLYGLVVGPVAFALSRRWRPAAGWVALPVCVAVATGACLLVTRDRQEMSVSTVEVRTLGADGTVLTTAYRGMLALDPPDTVADRGAATSTVFTSHPLFRSLRGQLNGLAAQSTQVPVARGRGGGTVIAGGDRTGVRLGARPWELRTVQEVSVDHGGPVVDATLRVTHSSGPSSRRIAGTVTNGGPLPIHGLRAQILEGQARLADELAPGETREVDAPVVFTVTTATTGDRPLVPEEVAMFAAASQAFTGPDQVALVGLTSRPVDPAATTTSNSGDRRISVVVSLVPLQAAETVLVGSGGSRLVASSPRPDGGRVNVLDLSVPPGAGPLSARYDAVPAVPGPGQSDPGSIEVYNWTSGTWRMLPSTGRGREGFVYAPLTATELNDGLARLRAQRPSGAPALASAQLILTSTAEAQAQR